MAMTNLIMAPKGGYLDKSEIARRLPAILTREKHPSRSNKYLTVVTEDVIDGLWDRGYRLVEAQVCNTRKPDMRMSVKHILWLVQKQYLGSHQLNDEWPRLGIVNSFGGQSAWEILLGVWRLACLNGLVVPVGRVGTPLKIAHKTINTLDDVMAATYTIAEEADQRMVQVSEWKQLQLDRPEQELFARGALIERFGNAAVVEGTLAKGPLAYDVEEVLRSRRYEDRGNDLWHTFNRAEENLHNGFVRHQMSGRKARAVNSIDGKLEFEQGLWNLAEEFAALKQGAI